MEVFRLRESTVGGKQKDVGRNLRLCGSAELEKQTPLIDNVFEIRET